MTATPPPDDPHEAPTQRAEPTPDPGPDQPQADPTADQPQADPTADQPQADPTADQPQADQPQPDPTAEQPQADPTHGSPTEPRRLLRATGDDRVIAGVCAGIARSLAIDPLIVRLAAVVLTIFGGAAIVAYLAAWALIPADDGTGRPDPGHPSRVRTLVGAVLVLIAATILLGGHHGWGWGHWTTVVAFTLVPTAAVVAALAYAGQRMLHRHPGEGRTQTAGRLVGAAFLALAACIAAVLAMVGAAWATAAGAGEVIAAIVIALGAAMVLLSFRRPGARWLAVPALVLAIPAGVVAAAGVDVDGSVGQRTRTPASVADIPAEYRLGVGELVVDLRRLDWPTSAPVDVKLRLGAGHALVLVPENVCVQADNHMGAGWIGLLGSETAGADLDEQEGTLDRTMNPGLRLTADVGMGALEVRHERVHHDNGFDHRRSSTEHISTALANAGCAGARP